MDGILGFANQ